MMSTISKIKIQNTEYNIEASNGVYVGSVEPTDPNIQVWANPDEDGESDVLDLNLITVSDIDTICGSSI